VQEAATVHIAPLSVSRWEDYTAALQPAFSITPAQALSLALPRTFSSQTNLAEIFSAGLQVGLPQSTSTDDVSKSLTSGSTSSGNAARSTTNAAGTTTTNGATTANASNSGNTSTTSTVTTNGGATTTQTTTTQQGPGTLPPNLLPSASLPNAASLTAPSGSLALDPMLTYQAATAVYQEIQLLNNYINDAAHQYGTVPYVGRVQVSVVPMAHNEPYDVYVNLGFVSRCRGRLRTNPVVVIPLLVTDDVETGQSSTAVDQARQLAASIGAVTSNVALQAGLSQLKNQFKAILGTDYNSLYMVTRALDNVLQVRFGAARSTNPNVKYSMLTQTHDVSFLMLVNKEDAALEGGAGCFGIAPEQGAFSPADVGDASRRGPQVWINGYTRIRDATSGAELPIDRDAIQSRAVELLHRFQPLTAQTPITFDMVSPLIRDVQENSTENFRQDLCDLLDPQLPQQSVEQHAQECLKIGWGTAASAWTSLASVVDMSEYSGTFFNLPRLHALDFDQTQALYLHDNCKDTASVTIGGNAAITPGQYKATLKLPSGISLSANAIGQATAGGPLTVKFPSLYPFRTVGENGSLEAQAVAKALGLACPSKEAQAQSAAAAKAAEEAAVEATAKEAAASAAAAAAAKAAKAADAKDGGAAAASAAASPGSAPPQKGKAHPAPSPATEANKDGATPPPAGDADASSASKAKDALAAAQRAKANAAAAQKRAAAAKKAATDLAPLVELSNVQLSLERVVDGRWDGKAEAGETDAAKPTPVVFNHVYYDGANSQPSLTVSLTASIDTITAVSSPSNPGLGGTGLIRLFITPGKDLADVVLSFSGASLASVPTLVSGGHYVQAAEALQTPPQAAATLKITPPNGTAFDPGTPIVVDANLQALVATRVVVVTATGHDINKAAGGSAAIALPVVAPASANTQNNGQQGATPAK
jgi:hypothetical protein